MLVVLFVGGGPATAATELVLSPASGPPGTTFTITGSGFAPGAVVKLHWGSQSGLELATGIGPDFTTTAVVPESPPNSHPVVAVVTEGTSVSTSSASFQVTSADAPVTTTTLEVTTTTVAAPPPTTATTQPAPSSRSNSGFDPAPTGRDTSGLGGGVDGGVMPDTTGGGPGLGEPGTAAAGSGGTGTGTGTGAGAGGSSTVSTLPGSGPEITTVPALASPSGLPPSAPAAAGVPQSSAEASRNGDAAAGATPPSTSQSAGAVSNPILLVVGLGLVFGGGVFLAVRNRQRA